MKTCKQIHYKMNHQRYKKTNWTLEDTGSVSILITKNTTIDYPNLYIAGYTQTKVQCHSTLNHKIEISISQSV